MDFINLNDLRERLKGFNGKDISRKTGLHFNTVYKVINGKEKTLSLYTYQKLLEFLHSETVND